MRILITRPREDAEPFARALIARGHEAVIEPLLEIAYRAGPPLDLEGVQAILVTSANGARAAALRVAARDIAVIAVGPATAGAAREAGFTRVSESPGEGVDALAAFVRAKLRASDGTLVHPTGSVTAGDLAGALGAHGFSVRREAVYEARAVDHLSGALVAELSAGLIDAATFFSPRTAGLFAELVADEGLEAPCRLVTAICLSQAVAGALAPLGFAAVKTAKNPSSEAMLALIG